MAWGGSYAGMNLDSECIVNLQAAGPDITVLPGSYNFGSIALPNTSSNNITISNAGTEDLNIGFITVGGSQVSEFGIRGDTRSGQTLTPASSCAVQVTFAPSPDGSKSAVLSVPSDNPDENPANVPLSGSWTGVSVSGPNKKGIYSASGSFTTQNAGSLNAGNVFVNYYLSSDPILDGGDALISASKIKSMGAGSSKVTNIRYGTNSATKGKHPIAESSEGNNRAATGPADPFSQSSRKERYGFIGRTLTEPRGCLQVCEPRARKKRSIYGLFWVGMAPAL